MATQFASGKFAIAICDRCGFKFKLTQLRRLSIKNKRINVMVCRSCWEPSHPQLMLGTYPVYDPQALRNARPDSPSYEESRDTAWGWNPVGSGGTVLTNGPVDTLLIQGQLGQVTVG